MLNATPRPVVVQPCRHPGEGRDPVNVTIPTEKKTVPAVAQEYRSRSSVILHTAPEVPDNASTASCARNSRNRPST